MIDLHTHSTASDGTDSPAALARAARAAGLGAIALTDHNNVDALPEFLTESGKIGLTAVAGVEFSTEWRGTELHLLGLFLDEASFPAICGAMESLRRSKEQSNRELAERLCAAGYDVPYDEAAALAGGNYVNRAHFATLLARKGYVPDRTAAFRRLLDEGRGFYFPAPRPQTIDMIAFTRSLHAVPVLAHPYLNLSQEQLLELLPAACEAGLAGMEAFYSEYSRETTALALETAVRHNLVPSGGSDYHGGNKPYIRLGIGRGDLFTPDWVLPALLAQKN
ncbi:MAG: PHP domain-containing protein [Firmicutes bacterium]|nr:PHP domain-containing protein [Bacillota bacterium]